MQGSSANRSFGSTESLLLVCVLIWAANAPLVKFGISGLDVLVFNGIRFVVAGASLTIIYLSRSAWTPVPGQDWLRLLGLALIAHVVYQLAYIYGIKNTSVGNSVIILSTSPLWTVFFNFIIHREKVPFQAWIGSGVSLFGIILIVIGAGSLVEFGGNALLGDGLSVLAAMLWGLSTTLQKNFLKYYSATQLSVLLVSIGAFMLTLLAIPSALRLHWGNVGTGYYAAAFTSGAMSIGASTVLWAVGIKKIGPRKTANYNNLVPILAFIFAYLALGEQIFLLQVIGAAITLGGVWVARR